MFNKNRKIRCLQIIFISLFIFKLAAGALAQEVQGNATQPLTKDDQPQNQLALVTAPQEAVSTNVTLDFKDAEIKQVLRAIAYKSQVNIVTTPEVAAMVTINLKDVPWQKALDVILKTYGFGYEQQGNIIMVAPIAKLTEQRKLEQDLAQVQTTVTEVFVLKFLDAADLKKTLEPQLSSRGKITVLEETGQAGWEFGGAEIGKRRRAGSKQVRSKTLVITDVPEVMNKIKEIVAKLDVQPQQILIEARLMEVNLDTLKDIGFDWGTGSSGAETSAVTGVPVDKSRAGNSLSTLGGHVLGSEVTPSGFGPKATGITGVEPYSMGAELVFKKLTGTQFEAIVHALQEDVNTNTLSAPHIMTLNNQEATILVGTKYPILSSEVSTQSAGNTVTTTLDYYQDVGIQLNVVPQVNADDLINMIVHPVVSSYTLTSGTGTQYPIIDTREAETQVLMKDGETIVIGGLIKDVKSKSRFAIPFISKLPFIGVLFRRDTEDTQKVDLLIFITARIIKPEEFSPEKIAALQERLDKSKMIFEEGKKRKKRR